MQRNNLTVNGSGSFGGGMYGKVKVNGEAEIVDHLDCLHFTINGTSKVAGDIKAECLSVHGEAGFDGTLQADKASVLGTCKIGKNAHIQDCVVRGSLEIDGNYNGDKAEIKGLLVVKNDLEAETFISKGQFQVGGLLNADEIEISLRYKHSHAGEIGGKKINVKVQNGLANMFHASKKRLLLQASAIEGDDIYLENTDADTVRGQNIEIGPGCRIRLVEYEEKLKVLEDAVVLEKQKL
jgi:cytoskeletal protein CcmA (bactofilin family)